MPANEIIIVIKARNETTGVFEALKRDAALAGDGAGEAITERITEKIKVIKDDPTLRNAGTPIGDTIGETISRRIKEKVKVSIDESVDHDTTARLRNILEGKNSTEHEKIKVDVDVDEQSFGAKLRSFFDRFKAKIGIDEGGFLSGFKSTSDKAGDELTESLRTGVTSVFSGDIVSTAIKTALIGALGVGAFSFVGPALGSAIGLAFGGGAIGAGVIAALKDPGIQTAITGLKGKISSAFTGFGDLFRGPVFLFLSRIPEAFKPLQPMISQIAHDLAPVATALSDGVIGFLQNVLPSIGRAVDKSGPLIQTLADNLPGIGDAIGRLIDNISSHPKETAEFFNGLLDGIQLLLKFLGVLVTISFGAYKTITQLLTGIVVWGVKAANLLLDAFIGAFGWIPGLGGKLNAAKAKMNDFANNVVKELNKVPDSKTFTLYIRTVGANVGATLGNIGRILGRSAGGIMGSASGATPSGLTWVGEHGPELLSAPAGSRVHSNPDSMRMADGMAGGSMIQVNLHLDGQQIAGALVDPQRHIVRTRFGGSVQAAYGRGA